MKKKNLLKKNEEIDRGEKNEKKKTVDSLTLTIMSSLHKCI